MGRDFFEVERGMKKSPFSKKEKGDFFLGDYGSILSPTLPAFQAVNERRNRNQAPAMRPQVP